MGDLADRSSVMTDRMGNNRRDVLTVIKGNNQ